MTIKTIYSLNGYLYRLNSIDYFNKTLHLYQLNEFVDDNDNSYRIVESFDNLSKFELIESGIEFILDYTIKGVQYKIDRLTYVDNQFLLLMFINNKNFDNIDFKTYQKHMSILKLKKYYETKNSK